VDAALRALVFLAAWLLIAVNLYYRGVVYIFCGPPKSSAGPHWRTASVAYATPTEHGPQGRGKSSTPSVGALYLREIRVVEESLQFVTSESCPA
jgi:hypothetical protein